MNLILCERCRTYDIGLNYQSFTEGRAECINRRLIVACQHDGHPPPSGQQFLRACDEDFRLRNLP